MLLEGSKFGVQFHALFADYEAVIATVVTKRARLLFALTVLTNLGCLELRHATSSVGTVTEIQVPGKILDGKGSLFEARRT